MESGFLVDISPEENQLEAGLKITISNNKKENFIGNEVKKLK